MVQLSNLENKTSYELIKDNFDKYVVTPANAFGLGGFVFDVDGETSINAVSEITDHFVEDNSAVQDHIATRPLTVTLGGFVGELSDVVGGDLQDVQQKAVQKLTVVSAYLPVLSTSAAFVKDVITDSKSITTDQAINNVNNIYATVKNLNPSATKQQKAYTYFKALRDQKILVSLQTPFEYLPNMAIETLIATQGEDTNTVSTFSITLKQIRTVSTKFVSFNPSNFQTKSGEQTAPEVDKGKAQGKTTSALVDIIDSVGGIFN